MKYPENRVAAEHAAAELMTRGIWTCACEQCTTARKATEAAVRVGFCRRCGKVLVGKRKSAKYCCNAHRVAACEARDRARQIRAMPLFDNPGLAEQPTNLIG